MPPSTSSRRDHVRTLIDEFENYDMSSSTTTVDRIPSSHSHRSENSDRSHSSKRKRKEQSSGSPSSKRQPLHQRSNSQTNQYQGPTIRIVEDPGTDVYSKTPFPSQPSQILSPRNRPGYVFEGRGARVSDTNPVTNAVPKLQPISPLVPKPLQPRRANRHSTSTNTSDEDTLIASSSFSFSPLSSRFSQGTTPPTSPPPDDHDKKIGLEVLEEEVPKPERLTIRAVPPSSSSNEEPFGGHALTPRASASSLASSASSDTPTLREHEDRGGSSASVPPLPPKHHRRDQSSGSVQKKQASSTNKAPYRPAINPSVESFAYSDVSYTSSERPRSSSQPSPTVHSARQVQIGKSVKVQYPIVRAPSASSSWAESQVLPKNPSRMNNRASQVHQWSSQLSTIPSESERGSRSIDRSQENDRGSRVYEDNGGRSNVPRRRQTIGSISSLEGAQYHSDPTDSSVSVPLPLFSPVLRPPGSRDSDEHHDTVSPLQSPPLRKQRSGFLRRHASDSRSSSPRPSSSQSDLATFVASTIPAWARVYYRRGERSSIGAPESSTEGSDSVRVPTAQSGRTNTPSESNFPLSIYRPRNRPHQHLAQPVTDSMIISDAPIEQEVYVIGPQRRPNSEPFTPRLRQDRRSQARLSAWKAPSFDDNLGSLFFSRQNRQILLFCIGFIFPFAWIIGSFLPLPPDPELSKEATPSQIDLERQFTRNVGPVEDKSYQKANWWRNLNRIMSGIGILLVGVIIALAILASRMS